MLVEVAVEVTIHYVHCEDNYTFGAINGLADDNDDSGGKEAYGDDHNNKHETGWQKIIVFELQIMSL